MCSLASGLFPFFLISSTDEHEATAPPRTGPSPPPEAPGSQQPWMIPFSTPCLLTGASSSEYHSGGPAPRQHRAFPLCSSPLQAPQQPGAPSPALSEHLRVWDHGAGHPRHCREGGRGDGGRTCRCPGYQHLGERIHGGPGPHPPRRRPCPCCRRADPAGLWIAGCFRCRLAVHSVRTGT